MGSFLGRVALHVLALAILLWPMLGLEFMPMVDMPGHLAIVRVLDDVLHGSYRDTLRPNLDPVYKPTYALLWGIYRLLPRPMVAAVAVGLLVVAVFAAVRHGLAALSARPPSSPLVVALATAIAMLQFNSAFFWGLLPFLASVPLALVAYVAYLRASGIADPTPRAAARFLLAGVAAHVVHPLSSFFLALVLAPAAAVGLAAPAERGALASRLWRVGAPLAAWAGLVIAVHLLGAVGRGELDAGHAARTVAAPFHGPAAARRFLRQIPIELDLRPTRNPAGTRVVYPTALAAMLAGAGALAGMGGLVAAARRRRPGDDLGRGHGGPAARLAAVGVASAALVLFLRHDLVRVSMGSLWYPVRAPGFLAVFFGVLGAAVVARLLAASRFGRLLSALVAVAALGLALERSAVLRAHFVDLDREARVFVQTRWNGRWFRRQPVTYIDHLHAYRCYYGETCADHHRLFFAIYPEATIYPLSLRTRPAAPPLTGRRAP